MNGPRTRDIDSNEDTLTDAINILSLEEVYASPPPIPNEVRTVVAADVRGGGGGALSRPKKTSKPKKSAESSLFKRAKEASRGTAHVVMQPAGASADIVRSGHIELNTIYASNDSEVGRQPITVNVVNAPNNSTLQCGCENISCPFCNLILSIEKTDPSVLQ